MTTTQTPRPCADCRAGDHTGHRPALSGICVGCPCPVRATPDGRIAPPTAAAEPAAGPVHRDVGAGYSPGRDGTVTVSLTGRVDAVDRAAGTVTIGGWTLPIRLDGAAVRHVSSLPPAAPSAVVLDECECGYADDGDRVARGWHDAVRAAHDDDAHPGAFLWCSHALCRRTRETYR